MLQKGAATIRLAPQCLLTGTIACDELTKAGKPLGWTNVYLMRNGERLAMCDSNFGHFRFLVAPSEYVLFAYGTCLHKKFVSVTVPCGVSEYQAPPIELNSSRLDALKGHPAPEPAGIVGWKGQAVKIADLRGKYVLVDFWGYWCGPCVGSMPVMIDLQEKYKDKGLAILSVHVDVDGDVGTAAELDEKIAGVKASLWGGRDLPFSTALSRGAQTPDGYDGITAAQFGVLGFPTTILIDRQGNVVGQFSQARDLAAAEGEIDRLFAANK
jgi:thiol-disulfide isomerase/thioredoxin